MEVIDVHTHVGFVRNNLVVFAESLKFNPTFDGLLSELKKNNISRAFAITENLMDTTPLCINEVKKLQVNQKVSWICGINPLKAGAKEIAATDAALSEGVFKGLKIYLGYYPIFPSDKVYEPFYKLAQKHSVPVFFHTGDTFGANRFVKFAHPLNIDEVAVNFPDINLVLCHFGNPWCIDAAELVYKNPNVYADLSGFNIGHFKVKQESKFLFKRIETALEYCGYNKLLYGTDWPLVDMLDYFCLIKGILPRRERKNVFAKNAKKLFNL